MNTFSRLVVIGAAIATLGGGAVAVASAQGGPMAVPGAPAGPAGQWRPGPGWAHRGPWRAGEWHRGPHRPHAWRGRRAGVALHAGPGMLVGGLVMQLRNLDLTASQRTKVRELIKQARTEQRAAWAHPQYDLTVVANPGSPNYAKAVQYLQHQATQRIARASQLARHIYQILTPKQRQDLATLLAAQNIRIESQRERMQRVHHQGPAHRQRGPRTGDAP